MHALDKGWKFVAVDVEDTFLNTEFRNTQFLEWPQGMVEIGFITD